MSTSAPSFNAAGTSSFNAGGTFSFLFNGTWTTSSFIGNGNGTASFNGNGAASFNDNGAGSFNGNGAASSSTPIQAPASSGWEGWNALRNAFSQGTSMFQRPTTTNQPTSGQYYTRPSHDVPPPPTTNQMTNVPQTHYQQAYQTPTERVWPSGRPIGRRSRIFENAPRPGIKTMTWKNKHCLHY